LNLKQKKIKLLIVKREISTQEKPPGCKNSTEKLKHQYMWHTPAYHKGLARREKTGIPWDYLKSKSHES
jgi:hypothetical protein